MELIRKNIHMDRIKCSAKTQLTLEDDRNLPEQKPDMERIILRHGEIKTEEIKVSDDKAGVKGKLLFAMLYVTDESGVGYLEGELPFEEQVYLEGVKNADNVEAETELEDLSMEMINSRKLSIRALLSLKLSAEDVADEEMTVDLYHDAEVETKKEVISVAQIAVFKKDILRRREELEMPKSFPNIFEILWKDVRINGLSFEALDDQIAVQGELEIFFLYEGENSEQPLWCYEKTIPFREMVDCQGSSKEMIPDISGRISHSELDVRTDEDGEERIVCLDLLLDLHIKLYRSEEIEVLTDVYGISQQLCPVKKESTFHRRLLRAFGQTKLTEQMKLPASLPEMAEIYHSSASAVVESMEQSSDGVELIGTLQTEILYCSEHQETASFEAELPFQYVLPVPDILESCRYRVIPAVSQLTVTMLGSSEVDIKALISFTFFGFCCSSEQIVAEIAVRENDRNVINNLPGMAVCIAKEGDDIWELGKKYYVPLDRIREMNQLERDVLGAGEKILIVR